MTSDINWRDQANIDKLQGLLLQGLSASKIADHFGRATRNVINGAVHRLMKKGALYCGFANKPARKIQHHKPRVATTGLTAERLVRGKDNQPEIVTFHELQVPQELATFNASKVGFPMADLNSDQCMWPVKDDPFLFCGDKVSELRYCVFHATWSRRR